MIKKLLKWFFMPIEPGWFGNEFRPGKYKLPNAPDSSAKTFNEWVKLYSMADAIDSPEEIIDYKILCGDLVKVKEGQ